MVSLMMETMVMSLRLPLRLLLMLMLFLPRLRLLLLLLLLLLLWLLLSSLAVDVPPAVDAVVAVPAPVVFFTCAVSCPPALTMLLRCTLLMNHPPRSATAV